MMHRRKDIPIYFELQPHTKYKPIATGASINMDQKSGCNINSRKTLPTIKKNGANQSDNVLSTFRFFFMKYASIMMSHIFMNSTGCIDGIQGILSQPLAPLYSSHTNKTAMSRTNTVQNIFFACFSRKL